MSPVFAGLMLTARAGSAIATQLGTMRVTDQIDALATMAVNPIQYLVTPRIVAGVVMMPVLCMVFTVIGLAGAHFVSIGQLGIDPGAYEANLRYWLDGWDIVVGLIKSVVFGYVVTLVACRYGFDAKGGAAGVGVATTKAVVIGGSGAGKTVLLRQLIGLERPTSGRVLVDGENISAMNDVELNRVRRKFGMVFQGAALFDSMTVYDNVAFPLREHTKLSESEIKEKVRQRLEDLGLPGAEGKMPGELSGGMRKRVGVARALMLEPQILIYDEPTTGLDPVLSRSVDDIIRDMREKFHVTSIVISHDMATAFGVAHRIHMLYQGRIVASGTPEDFLANDDPVVREFVHSSGVSPETLEGR
jgi:phospholipid/cholesterol/gamma-HCH transport system ATP-binding protein